MRAAVTEDKWCDDSHVSSRSVSLHQHRGRVCVMADVEGNNAALSDAQRALTLLTCDTRTHKDM